MVSNFCCLYFSLSVYVSLIGCLYVSIHSFLSTGQRVGVCNTSGSGADLPWDHSDLAETHGPLPQSASLFLGFAFMLTASSESDRQTNQPISDGEEGEKAMVQSQIYP